jgi:hypothetical protein
MAYPAYLSKIRLTIAPLSATTYNIVSRKYKHISCDTLCSPGIWAYLLNSELKPPCNMCEKEDNTKFIGRSIFHRRVFQGNRLVS